MLEIISNINRKINKLSFVKAKQQAFLEDVGILVKDGVPAQRAIAVVYEVSTGTSKEVAKAIMEGISQGQRISESMSGWFSPVVVEIVRTGEEGGTLLKSLRSAANSLAQKGSALSSLMASTTYPIIVFFAALILLVFLKRSVFTNFASIKPVSQWPDNGQTVYALATFVEYWWWLIMGIIIGTTIFIRGMLVGLTGDLRRIVDKFPLLDLYKDFVSAQFMETLGLLLANGVPFKQALNLLQKNAGKYLAWHISLMQFRLSGGQENIADVLDTGMIDRNDIFRLRAMAKGKGFDQSLLNLGLSSLDRSSKKVKTVGRIIGGLLLSLDAGLAIYIIFAVYGVGSSIGGM